MGNRSDRSTIPPRHNRPGSRNIRQHVSWPSPTRRRNRRSIKRTTFLERKLAEMGRKNGTANRRDETDTSNVGVNGTIQVRRQILLIRLLLPIHKTKKENSDLLFRDRQKSSLRCRTLR